MLPSKRDGSQPAQDPAKKRRRGANRLSCAECRRLKLRCDRGVPCSSCVKRGCSAICPDGSLTTGQGNRFVLASTQELHEKINELCIRVRTLEDALRSSHSRHSNEGHPLLADELLKIKMPLQRDVPPARPQGQNNGPLGSDEDDGANVVDAVGSLSISYSGLTKYYGNSSNSWYFLQNEDPESVNEVDERIDELRKHLPPQILALTGTFPLSPIVQPGMDSPAERLASLYWYLPTADKAADLRNVYYQYAAWMYNPLPSAQFDEEVYYQFYGLGANSGPSDDPIVAHRLALMFMVCALGSLMDPRAPPFGVEAERYHQLARAALFQSNIVDDPTVAAVQALYMMTYYFFLADRHGVASGSRFAIMGLAIKLAQSIGLHRDCGRFNLPPMETQRRRQLFWELYTYDLWQCFTLGRPPNFNLAHIDCKQPYPAGEVPVEQVFEQWKHRFTAECMSVLLDQAFGAKTPKYATVLQLDRKLRASPVPPVLQIAGFGNSDPRANGGASTDSAALVLQRHIVLAIREMSLLYLHRSFFARAISDHPKDPLGSPYGSSVIAAYRSAGSLVALMRNLHSQLKGPNERTWFLWGHVFSCAIVLGSIVTRCPSMSLAPSALLQLDSACELFSRTAGLFRAQKVLGIMLKLRTRAHSALAAFRDGKPLPLPSPLSASDPSSPGADEEDELFTLGAKTRLVAKGGADAALSPASVERSPTSLNPIVPLPLSPGARDVHPNLVEYLRTFGPAEAGPSAGPAYEQAYGMAPMAAAPMAYGPAQMMAPQVDASVFPQYFPVFDYGPAGGEFPPMEQIMEGRRDSRTPENMQTTWQDFVAQLGM